MAKKVQKKTKIIWHPATKSPGKKRVLMAFRSKKLKKRQFYFTTVRFFSSGIIPAESEFKSPDGEKILPVAWCWYADAIKGVTEKMCHEAECTAWAWWPDDKEE